jgi:hypothetical protein
VWREEEKENERRKKGEMGHLGRLPNVRKLQEEM